jgi:hypothetical protein
VAYSGGAEFGHALVTEVIADVRAEKAALRFGTEEGLMVSSREAEVAINIARVAESAPPRLCSTCRARTSARCSPRM